MDKSKNSAMETACTFLLCLLVCPDDVKGIQCSPGLHADQTKGKCYRYMQEKVGWQNAKTSCQTLGGQLMKMEDASDLTFVTTNVVSGVEYWIGLNDKLIEDDFQWADTTPLTNTIWTNWLPGQPNDSTESDDQDCCIMDQTNQWQDKYCLKADKYEYVCEFTAGFVNNIRSSIYDPQADGSAPPLDMEEMATVQSKSAPECALICEDYVDCSAITSKSSATRDSCKLWRKRLQSAANSLPPGWRTYIR